MTREQLTVCLKQSDLDTYCLSKPFTVCLLHGGYEMMSYESTKDSKQRKQPLKVLIVGQYHNEIN